MTESEMAAYLKRAKKAKSKPNPCRTCAAMALGPLRAECLAGYKIRQHTDLHGNPITPSPAEKCKPWKYAPYPSEKKGGDDE